MEVAVFDHKDFEKLGPAGCNMCAGIIPDSLVRSMQELGMSVPDYIIQRQIEGYLLETRGGSADIPSPPGSRIYATFRGPGPLGMYPSVHEGFDWLLLAEAQRNGASHVSKLVTELHMPEEAGAPYHVVCRDGFRMAADLVVGAFGVNSNLGAAFQRLGFGYRPPRTLRARQAEIPLDPDYIQRQLRNRVLIFALGQPGVRFAAITPKREHVTVTLVGHDPDHSRLAEFLDSRVVRRHLPEGWAMPARYCSCAPRLPISAACNPVSERLVVIGDANTSRYLKNGIESSYYTAKWAAEGLVSGRLGESQLRRQYLRICRQTYGRDNACGRMLLVGHDFISRSTAVSRAHMRVVRHEQAGPRAAKPLSEVLWGMFTGNIPYRAIARKLMSPRLQARLAAAAVVSMVSQLAGRGDLEASPRPLCEGDTVIIIGGGPAGAACAIALARTRQACGRGPRVVLIEAKQFGQQQNQCAGVLSPPGPDAIARDLGVALPPGMLQRRIIGYVLHGETCSAYLDGQRLGESPHTLRRVELDTFLLDQAKRLGVEVVHSRATDIEFAGGQVVVYTDTGSFRGAVVLGAFALDEGMARAFSRRTRYRPPASLETLACKIHPAGLAFAPGLLDDCIHVFLPGRPPVDFGALIPKGNHIVVLVAGARLSLRDLEGFMAQASVRKLLPAAGELQGYFKGAFPLGPARGLYGDRYMMIGDAAGLVRPFKGKGINAAIEGGVRCARAMLAHGVSRDTFSGFVRSQQHLIRDVWYGRLVRWLVTVTSRRRLLDPFVVEATRNQGLSQVLFDCISGRTTYREVVLRSENLRWVPGMLWRCLVHKLGPHRSIEPGG